MRKPVTSSKTVAARQVSRKSRQIFFQECAKQRNSLA